jgi:drug/metabolite transporter (DMT)-like permease
MLLLGLVWALYFVTDVYGHIALKMATDAPTFRETLFSIWGLTAVASWLISFLAWTFVLSKHPLLTANTVSAVTYILISLSAVILFREPITKENLLGVIFVFAGIYLIIR